MKKLQQLARRAGAIIRRLPSVLARIPIAVPIRRCLLLLESVVVFPVFLASWLLCGLYYAVKAGQVMAASEEPMKHATLDNMLGVKKSEK